MPPELLDSVVLITSKDSDNPRFGTGFVVRRAGDMAYVVTCAHVVRDVGAETIWANGIAGVAIASGDELGLDLAVLKVEGLTNNSASAFELHDSGAAGKSFRTEGFQVFDARAKTHLKKSLRGTLSEPVQLTPRSQFSAIRAWELHLSDGNIQDGYSGSPVIDDAAGTVLGVISHRIRDGVGLAISIEELERIWKPVESEQVREVLMGLGYRAQVMAFQRLLTHRPIGAYLIHGPSEEYGQQWLLNRLLTQFLRYSVTAKGIRIELNRVGRRNDVTALWQELGKHAGFKGRAVSASDIVQRVVQWWETRDVILALYDVDCLSEEQLSALINDFWLPLASQAEPVQSTEHPQKLLMFLIDFEGSVAERNVPFVEKLDASWRPQTPLRSPRIREFSEDELMNWVLDRYDKLPEALTQEAEETIRAILETADNGIPERTLGELCDRFGYDWYQESQKWYRL